MDNSKDREKIAKEIAKTSDSIRKKYRALKPGKMEKDIALERHSKPIIDPLKQIVENTVESSKDPSMNETFFSGEDEEPKSKRKRSSASTPVKSVLNRSKTAPSASNEMSEIIQPHELSYDHVPSVEEIFEVTDEPLVTSVRHLFQTSEGQEKLQTGKRYDGKPGLYELIFMKFRNESICTVDDVQTYRSILLTTNAHRRGHSPSNKVMGSKGYVTSRDKYRYKNFFFNFIFIIYKIHCNTINTTRPFNLYLSAYRAYLNPSFSWRILELISICSRIAAFSSCNLISHYAYKPDQSSQLL
ncbi:hypothetical protein ALC57_08482 [Trachymyrmex cornetzi]|uniref:DUF8207 domain-containing protein n=1 Tax=Trachymyrmex cornetzi TaxID=471704 RepID=A0A151J774_9HYME|nr:hypothetical protein ALC57_08482 [Trachymyrmex cornetzi]